MTSDEEALNEISALLNEAKLLENVELDPSNDADLINSLKLYGVLRATFDALAAAKTKLEKRIDDYEASICIVFDNRKIKSLNVVGLGKVGTRVNNNPKVVSTEALHKWLRRNGEEGVIKESVHYQTLKKLINDRINDDRPYPDESIVELTPRMGLSLTRSK